MNIRDLQYLVALADHGHFGRAAEASFVSQPTLSTQIRKLETELGVELVERRRGGAMLTDAGARVVERARVMLAEVDNIDAIAQQARDPESGRLRLGLFPTIAPYLLPHVVGHLHARFPKLELLLVEEKTETLLDRLLDGQIDAAVLAQPVHDAGLVHDELFTEEFVLAVPVDHDLAARRSVAVSALAGSDVLLLEEGHCLRDQALSVCRMAEAAEHRGFRATSLETLRQMVAAGVGITLLPRLAVAPPVPEAPSIALVEFEPPVPRRSLAMFWRPTHPAHDLLPLIAAELRRVPGALVEPAHSRSGAPPT
ncbi:MAG: LysR substrate-binding domain-containing protein [Microthrixaceae bacterium]